MTEDEKCFEDVLQKYYSPETSEEENISFEAMIRRLKRILDWNIEVNDSLFNKERGPDIVRSLVTQFNNWKSLICTSDNFEDFSGLQHLVIHTMTKVCIYYWIRDSEVIAGVLRQIYICDGHFSSMFAHLINQSTSNQETRQKEYLSMVYFLTHAHKAKLEFSGRRFIDLRLKIPLRVPPVVLAAIYYKPELFILLLRHGAIVDRRSVFSRSDDWDLNMLLRHLIRILWASLGTETGGSSWDTAVISNTVNDVWLCLRYLLRGITQISVGELDFSLMKFEPNGLAVTSSSRDFIRSVSERGIVPRLVSRYIDPSELQHLCRLIIRDVLNRNWNLPFGIFSLPLPKILQSYINLSED